MQPKFGRVSSNLMKLLSLQSYGDPNVNWRALVPAIKGCLVGFLVMSIALHAGARPHGQSLPASPKDLVRRVVANELKDDPGHFMYRDTRERENGTLETKQMIETRDGVVGRLILINGKPLTPAQRDKENKRLNRLLSDPAAMASKRKEQQEDTARVRRMVGALPDAFTYAYDGTEAGPHGELVVLKFAPNPNYDPPGREQQVYTGMQGTMLIDATAERIVKIDGILFRDVSFGWGILGKLDRGGRFIVEQADVGGGHWEPTRMVLDFTGHLLIFKSLKIRSTDITGDYHLVPDDLTVAQGLEMLRKIDGVVAENQGQN